MTTTSRETGSGPTRRDDRRWQAIPALVWFLALAACSSSERAGGTGGRGGEGGRPGGDLGRGTGGTEGGGGRSAVGGAGGGATGAGGMAPAAGGRGDQGASGGAAQNGGRGAGGAAGGGGVGGSPLPAGSGGLGGGGTGPTGSGGSGTAGHDGGGGAGPVHDRCADPLPLAFVNGEATVSDDTSRATDELPTLTCGGAAADPLRGGQLYYRFTARAGREYAFRVKSPAFASVVFYVFPAGAPCTVDAIQTACRSEGVTGTRPTSTLSTTLTPFAPRDPGDYVVGVDTALAQGSPFTLTIFEYCGSAGGTDCKVKGCDLSLGEACGGNTLSACNADGTATVTTDCAMSGMTCVRGACAATVLDNIGYSGWTTQPAADAGAGGVTLLDFYEVTTSRTITQIEVIMVQPRVFTLDWRILEATNRAGPYQTIFSTTTMSGGSNSASSETTGPIQVPIVAGRFYAIGVALPAGARYYLQQQAEKSLPLEVFFGRLTSAAVVPSASSTASIAYPEPGTFVIAERVTTKL